MGDEHGCYLAYTIPWAGVQQKGRQKGSHSAVDM